MATNEDLARVIIKILCHNDCVSPVGDLNKYLKDAGHPIPGGANNLLRLIERFPRTFSIYPGQKTKGKIISIHTPVPLCRDHCTSGSQCQGGQSCSGLHICKYFLLSDCSIKKCSFGHIIQTDHNYGILSPFLLDRLDDLEIKCILRHVKNRTSLTKPVICSFYNSAKGCSKSNCPFLHVCKHFLENTCKFEGTCKRSHDITSPEVSHILRRFGVNVNRRDDLVLQDLRTMFESQDSSLTRFNSMSSLTSSDEQKPALKNQSRSARRQKSGQDRSLSPAISFKDAKLLQNMTQTPYPQPQDFGGARPKIRGQYPNMSGVSDSIQGQGQGQFQQNFQGQGQVQGQQREASNLPMVEKQVSKDKEKPDICIFNLRGTCSFKDKCFNVHKNMIYQWQYYLNDWTDFDSNTNEEIEMDYCQPQKANHTKCRDGKVDLISFTEPMEMTTGSDETKMAVRRLSTISSVNAPPGNFKWTTEWQWYWKNLDGAWVRYGEKDALGAKSSIDSDMIEEKYLKDPKSSINFETSRFKYELDFVSMTQKNMNTENMRRVARRPLFFKKEELDRRQSTALDTIEPVPKEWSVQKFRTSKNLIDHYEKVQLEETSEEYKQIADLFSKTMPRDKLRRITRVESGEMWNNFSLKRKQMMTKAAGKQVKELSLFHGTVADYIEPICHQGFDFRFSGTRVGARLGKGSYFARDAKYSSDYTTPNERDHAKMFVARVLVGEFEVGNSSLVRPPQKNGFELYDSCVNHKSDPSIYVVFTLEQAYPEYLITYKTTRVK